MSFYSELLLTTARLIADKGQAMTLVSTAPGAYDASTGIAAEVETTSSLDGVVVNYPAREVDGTSVQRGDRKVLLAANGVVPKIQDTLIIGGVRNKIIDCKAVSPAGIAVMYTAQARAGG